MEKKPNQQMVELRLKVLSEYQQGTNGYKALARKYGLRRDTVRYWVLYDKNHEISVPACRMKTVKKA